MSFFTHEFSLPIAGDTYPHQENTLMTPFLFDWNEDGFWDIWFGNGSIPGSPLVEEEPWVILSDGAGGFMTGNSEVFSGPLATNVHPRYFVFEDFNGDGIKDVFISDNGQEQPPFAGHPNVLYLSNEDGKLEDASDRLPGYNHFSHNMAAADIDNDGDIDIFIANNADNTPVSYLLINDGVGNFAVNTSRLPGHLTDLATYGRYTWAGFFDIDRDGFNDLLLGSERVDPGWNGVNPDSGYSLIIYNDGAGNFTEQNTYRIPPPSISAHYSLVSLKYFDFQNDGHTDLFVGYEGDGQNVVQVYVSNGDGTFSNETESRLNGSIFGDEILTELFVLDVNGDGYADVVPDNRTPFFWINDGEGYFTAADESVLQPPAFAGYAYVGPMPGSAGPLNYFQGPFDGASYSYNVVRQTTPISTGPDYTDPASSGVPHFNEAYYLRVNPAAQAAVDAMTYDTGLEHYLAEGQALDLRIAANVGNGDDNELTAGEFGSPLFGNDGNDTLYGRDGEDTIDGGDGIDEANYASSPDAVLVDLEANSASGGYAEGDSYAALENIVGSTFADTLTGDDATGNALFGEGGTDSLNGGAGEDTLDGGSGDDTLLGGADNDSLEGFSGRDSLVGGAGDDFLHGYGSHDSLYGGNNNDDLRGGYGKDLLNGSGGNDVLRGTDGDDRLFGGGGADTLLGNDDNDSLTGGGGSDRLKGDDGDDTLNGRFGDDLVTGGAGNDLFEFRLGHGADTYDDFVAGAGTDDSIELIAFGAAFDTFAEVIAAASDNGTHTTIDFGGGDSILLLNVLVADLHEDDFVLS